jgi:hypothetical protein
MKDLLDGEVKVAGMRFSPERVVMELSEHHQDLFQLWKGIPRQAEADKEVFWVVPDS